MPGFTGRSISVVPCFRLVRWPIAAVLLFAVLGANSGCVQMLSHALPWEENKIDPNLPHYTVQIVPDSGTMQTKRLPFNQGATLQTALEESGARRKFRRMKVTLYRLSEGKDERERMQAKYDHVRRQMDPTTDYSLRPGDLVAVEEDPRTAFDDMLETLTGPMGATFGR